MRILWFTLLLLACSEKEEMLPEFGLPVATPKTNEILIWDIASLETTRDDRISFLLNQDSAFRHTREGYSYDGRFRVHDSGFALADTVWYQNGEKDSLLQKMRRLSVDFPNTRFFVMSFSLQEDSLSWHKEQGYSLWFKQL